jgi:hypothetical protein
MPPATGAEQHLGAGVSVAGLGAGFAGAFAGVAQNLGRAGPIPPPTPAGHPWAALLLGATLWALASLVVAAESARGGMRRRTWGWLASFLATALVAAYSFWRLL